MEIGMKVYRIVNGRRERHPAAEIGYSATYLYVRLLQNGKGVLVFDTDLIAGPFDVSKAAPFLFALANGTPPLVALGKLFPLFTHGKDAEAFQWLATLPDGVCRCAVAADAVDSHNDPDAWGMSEQQAEQAMAMLLDSCKPRDTSAEVDYRPAETVPEDYYA